MKTLLKKLFTILIVLFIYSCIIPGPASAQQGRVSFQIFYDQLSPYGQWVDYPDHGYVWIPDVGPDFSPYSTDGHWVITEYGWTWVSDYDWGWAPFHYGRWDYNDYYGWFWIADDEWGPSWVIWRRANGYYGWTPMRPGINVDLSFNVGYQDPDRWNFVQDQYFGRPDMDRYYSSPQINNQIIINSTVINNIYKDNSRNTTYIVGPRRDEVQRFTGRKYQNMAVRDYDKPGTVVNNNQLKIYRPRIERNNVQGQRPVPSRITDIKDIKRPKERTGVNQRNISRPEQNNQVQQQQQQRQKNNQVQQQQQERQKNNQVQQQQQQRQKDNQVQQQQQQRQKNNQVQQQQQQRQKDNQVQQQQQQRQKNNQIKQQQQQEQKVAKPVVKRRILGQKKVDPPKKEIKKESDKKTEQSQIKKD